MRGEVLRPPLIRAPVAVTPLQGFVPGIFAVTVKAVASVNGTVLVTLSSDSADSQGLYIFVK